MPVRSPRLDDTLARGTLSPAPGRRRRLARMADKGIIKQHPAPAVVAEPPPAGVVPGPLEYPDSDGRFLPEHPLQANAIVELRGNLKQHFRDRADVVVEGDMFLLLRGGAG